MTIGQMTRQMKNDGGTPWTVLVDLVADGVEYPDAEWAVTEAFGLDDDEVIDLREQYDNQC